MPNGAEPAGPPVVPLLLLGVGAATVLLLSRSGAQAQPPGGAPVGDCQISPDATPVHGGIPGLGGLGEIIGYEDLARGVFTTVTGVQIPLAPEPPPPGVAAFTPPGLPPIGFDQPLVTLGPGEQFFAYDLNMQDFSGSRYIVQRSNGMTDSRGLYSADEVVELPERVGLFGEQAFLYTPGFPNLPGVADAVFFNGYLAGWRRAGAEHPFYTAPPGFTDPRITCPGLAT